MPPSIRVQKAKALNSLGAGRGEDGFGPQQLEHRKIISEVLSL